jgi:hypothetical protein
MELSMALYLVKSRNRLTFTLHSTSTVIVQGDGWTDCYCYVFLGSIHGARRAAPKGSGMKMFLEVLQPGPLTDAGPNYDTNFLFTNLHRYCAETGGDNSHFRLEACYVSALSQCFLTGDMWTASGPNI